MSRISRQELYRLRNEIPIDRLIASVLEIPSRSTDGRFRFRCPVCNEFNTAVKPETNLARCFTCEKNFNTIDLTMRVKNLDFVAGIDFLKRCRKTEPDPCKLRTANPAPDKPPSHIGDVLSAIMPDHIDANKSIDNRLVALEKKVEYLTCRLNQITRIIE